MSLKVTAGIERMEVGEENEKYQERRGNQEDRGG